MVQSLWSFVRPFFNECSVVFYLMRINARHPRSRLVWRSHTLSKTGEVVYVALKTCACGMFCYVSVQGDI